MTLPRSTDDRAVFVYLRPDDTLDFPDQGFKVTFCLRVAGKYPERIKQADMAVTAQEDQCTLAGPEVQVRSSNVEPVIAEIGHQVDAATSDQETDDEGSYAPQSHSSVLTPLRPEHTPATSRPTVPTIKETPRQTTTNSFLECGDEEQFSTARDLMQEDDAVSNVNVEDAIQDTDSPLMAQRYRAAKFRLSDAETDHSRSQISKRLTNGMKTIVGTSCDGQMSNSASEAPYSDPGLPRGPMIAAEVGQAPFEHNHNITERGTALSSTDASEFHDMTEEAAFRNITNSQVKRRIFEAEGKRTSVSRKRQKRDSSVDGSVTHRRGDSGDAGIGEEDVAGYLTNGTEVESHLPDSGLASIPPRKVLRNKGRSQDGSGSRRRQPHDLKESIEGDKIVVAAQNRTRRKPSPQVLVLPRGTSKTSSAPALACSFSDKKVSKILVSSESHVLKSIELRSFLTKYDISITEDVPSKKTAFVCIVDEGHSLKTVKVLRTIALGRPVISDKWLVESRAAGELLDLNDFVPDELKPHVSRGSRNVFQSKQLLFTNTLVDKGYKAIWPDIVELAKEAGATRVEKGSVMKISNIKGRNNVIIFGADANDADALQLMNEHERTVYDKALIRHSIITGKLDLDDDDFKISVKKQAQKASKKTR